MAPAQWGGEYASGRQGWQMEEKMGLHDAFSEAARMPPLVRSTLNTFPHGEKGRVGNVAHPILTGAAVKPAIGMHVSRSVKLPVWRAKVFALRRLALGLLAAWVIPSIWAVADAKSKGRSPLWALCRVSGPLAILLLCVWWPMRRQLCWQ